MLDDFCRSWRSQLTYPRSDMTGTCPNGAVPPACIGGPKWTPNDPVFFMHHAVCHLLDACFRANGLSHRVITQMVDKVWYDWQQKSPRNKYSYGGGSVPGLANFSTFSLFPTGLPPYLNVSTLIWPEWSCGISCTLLPPSQFDSPIPGDGLWNVTIWDVIDTTGDTLCYIYV